MHAESAAIRDWWARPRGADTEQWIANYQRSLENRHRDVVVQAVQELGAETVLEIGCHCGPNLIRLAQACPEISLLGIDVSREAIESGRRWAALEGVGDRIQLNVGTVPDSLIALPTGSVDVAVSVYCLSYLSPDDIEGALYELGRVADRGVVLVEPMPVGEDHPQGRTSSLGYREWVHDYQTIKPWIGSLRDRPCRMIAIEPPVDALRAALVYGAC